MMNERWFYYFVGLVVIIVIALLSFLTVSSKPDKPNVVIYYTPPTPIIHPSPILQPPNEGSVNDISSSDEISLVTTELIPVTIESDDKNLRQLKIEDAMGNSIAEGMISLGTEPFSFHQGRVYIPSHLKSDIPVCATSAGYLSVCKIIYFATNDQPTIQMEYQSNYDIIVYEEDGKTQCQKATVKIWKSKIPFRPIQNVFPESYTLHGSTNRVCIKNKECLVQQNAIDSFPFPIDPTGRISSLLPRDRIVVLGNCIWNQDIRPIFSQRNSRTGYIYTPCAQSPQLRIWDTLNYS